MDAIPVAALLMALAVSSVPAIASAFPDESPSRARAARVLEFGSRPRRGEAPTTGGSFLSTGYARPAWLVLKLARFFHRPGRGTGLALERDEGRRVCEFPIGEQASGVFVRVSGRVEFERAMIGFADGRVESVEAFGLERRSGLFQLASFEDVHAVDWVRLVLRARSPKARVGVLVGR